MGGDRDTSEAAADAEAMGLPAEIIAQLQADNTRGFEVWPVNMIVVDAWLGIASQWRTSMLADGRMHWHGLDYSAVRAGWEMANVTVSSDTWAGVQVMERAAAAALNGYRG